jgi:hypothetical protein
VSAGEIVVMVVGIVAVVGLVFVPLMRRIGRMPGELASELTAAGEVIVLGPAQAIYRGATAAGYPRVKGNAAVALTESRLVFRKATGGTIEVPRAEISGVRQDRVFKGSVTGGRTHVIVQIPGGELAFFVGEPDMWAQALSP